jgi:hypothetical protein
MCVVISDTWFDPREKPVQLLIDNDARFCKADATSNAKTQTFAHLRFTGQIFVNVSYLTFIKPLT